MLIAHVSIVAEQCSQSQGYSSFLSRFINEELEQHKELGADKTRTSGPNRSRGHLTPYSIMLKDKTGTGQRAASAEGQAGHRSVGGEQLHCASLVLYTLINIIIFPFCPVTLPLSQPIDFTFF